MTANLFYENVPLVTTEAIGDFREAINIGHHYGDLTRSRVRCIKISPTKWLVSEHPWRAITGCWVGGKAITSFEPQVLTDIDGVSRQYVVLVRPPESEQYTVEVAGFGKQNSITGKLLENPDEIIQDLAAVCGKSLSFPRFREECNRRGLRIAGSVYETRTLRDYIAEIVDSCGAMWLGDDAYFIGGDIGYALPCPFATDITMSLDAEDIAGELALFYGWNQSQERNGAYIEIKAKGAQYSNKAVVYAKWIRQAKDAEETAKRLLARRAGEFVKVQATLPGRYRAGQAVYIRSRAYSGPMLIQTAQLSEASTQVTGEIAINLFSSLAVLRYSVENLSVRSERIDVAYAAGVATFTIFDVQNRPIEGIFIAVDNGAAKKTNAKGQAAFNLAVGDHVITLSGSDVSTDPYPVYVQ